MNSDPPLLPKKKEKRERRGPGRNGWGEAYWTLGTPKGYHANLNLSLKPGMSEKRKNTCPGSIPAGTEKQRNIRDRLQTKAVSPGTRVRKVQ